MRHSIPRQGPLGIDTAMINVKTVTEQLNTQLDAYKGSLSELQSSPFVAKMRALRSSII